MSVIRQSDPSSYESVILFFFILVVRFDDAFRVSYIRFAACSYVYARVFIKCVLCVGMFEFGFFIFSFLSVIRQLLHLLRTKLW